MRHPRLGFVGPCPSNVGTALELALTLKLPKLSEHEEIIALVATAFEADVARAEDAAAAEAAKAFFATLKTL